MANIKLVDHSEEIKGVIAELAFAALEEATGELKSQVQQNTKVKTGQTKNSWQAKVTGSMMAGEYRGTVGTDYENAIWEEFGTGDYALKGDGRKGGWFYVDENGKGHFTHGKKARRPFHHAWTSMQPKLIKYIQDTIKGGLK